MNGLELSAKIQTLTVPQMRKVWTAAVRELGTTTQKAIAYNDHVSDAVAAGQPRSALMELLWVVNCEKRVYTKTGKKSLHRSHMPGCRDQWVDETTCSWTESEAALARCFAAAQG